MAKRLALAIFIVALIGSIIPSCTMSYSFTGANISADVKTFSVYYFPNRARLINPTLSQSFTERLRTKLERQTSLNELSENGDLEFEGQITNYELRPMSAKKEGDFDVAAQTRLTVSVKVKYTNNKVPEESFEQSFTAYEDFDSDQPISSVEDDLNILIINKLTEDIFNASIANW